MRDFPCLSIIFQNSMFGILVITCYDSQILVIVGQLHFLPRNSRTHPPKRARSAVPSSCKLSGISQPASLPMSNSGTHWALVTIVTSIRSVSDWAWLTSFRIPFKACDKIPLINPRGTAADHGLFDPQSVVPRRSGDDLGEQTGQIGRSSKSLLKEWEILKFRTRCAFKICVENKIM